jgi:hypothetical protein
MALANAGCTVEAVCPSGHPLGSTSAVQRTHDYHGLTPLRSFTAAITATKPDLIVPGDDLATCHLHKLHRRAEGREGKAVELRNLIERSLGASESYPVVYARTAFMELAQAEGVRVPPTEIIAHSQDLRKWVARTGFPTVLKANGSSGGDGVRVVHTMEEAEDGLRRLQAPPLLARAAKRALVDHDHTLVWPSLRRRRFVVNAQMFIAGREATSTIACWKGTVLAGLHCEVINKADSAGHATVVRMIENAEMSAATETMVRRLNLSGLHGFDFMLEAHTGNAYLIEINPRATQVGHLTLGPGRDLPAALYAAVSGQALHAASKVTEKDTIALFPQEWIRDSASPVLQSGYHDVPWEEPELIQMCVRQRRRQSAWYPQKTRVQAFSAVRLPRL